MPERSSNYLSDCTALQWTVTGADDDLAVQFYSCRRADVFALRR
jgi:hypothetical protein